MPQVQKPEVRERILAAARTAFASRGVSATPMSHIAAAAGVAVANLYRYYPGKEQLYAAVVPEALVRRFDRLLAGSVRAHAQLASRNGPLDLRAGAELLQFWIDHRLEVVILLGRAQGTVHADFGQRFSERLVSLSLAEIRAAHPGVVIPREARLVLAQAFDNTRRMIATILESHTDEAAIRRAVAAFRAYQMGGLAAFSAWLAA
jgi:AcrR family transcriptional regulator